MHARGLALFGLELLQQVVAGGVVGLAELLPPVGEHLVDLAHVSAQAHEVECRTETGLLDQTIRGAAAAFFEAWLHGPDLAHVRAELAAAGHVADARVEHLVDGTQQRGMGMFAAREPLLPALAHVRPQHAGEQKARRHGLALGHAAVGIGQRRPDEGGIGALDHEVEQGVDAAREPELAQLLDGRERMTRLQQLEHFVEQAALRHVGQQRQRRREGAGGLGLEREAQRRELGGKAHRPDDAHRVFAVTGGGVADHAQHAVARVLQALVVVHHDLRLRVVVHGVDGEVAADRVFFLRAPDVVAQHAPAGIDGVLHAREFGLAGAFVAGNRLGGGVVEVGAEGGHLDDLVLAAAAEHDVHDAKAPADDEGTPEQALDLLGRGVGGDVEVLGAQPQQQVAHGAPDHIGLVACVLEGAAHLDGPLVDQRGIDAVHGRADLLAAAELWLAAATGLAEQLVDEGLDHGVSRRGSGCASPAARPPDAGAGRGWWPPERRPVRAGAGR